MINTPVTLIVIAFLTCCVCSAMADDNLIYFDVIPSAETVFVGQNITVTVTLVDKDPECNYSIMEMLIHQTNTSNFIFYPDSYFDTSGVPPTITFTFTAVRSGTTQFLASAYGEVYCGYWMWASKSGISVPVTVINVTPDKTPIPTPTSDPEPDCPETGIFCSVSPYIHPGKPFTYEISACNKSEEALAVDIYILLDLYGYFWFYPDWSADVDFASSVIPPCCCTDYMILDFIWPENLTIAYPLCFWNAMTEAGTLNLLGNISVCETGYY
ncbi:hypothetical protein JW979_13315 [bacterium]|nr:hypothetical protein [candidate division CSSED10-310 bacterium]